MKRTIFYTNKSAAIFLISFGVFLLILGIVFVCSSDNIGFPIFLIVVSLILIAIGIMYAVKHYEPKRLEKINNEKKQTYFLILEALLKDLGIENDCSNTVKERTIKDASLYLHVFTQAELDEKEELKSKRNEKIQKEKIDRPDNYDSLSWEEKIKYSSPVLSAMIMYPLFLPIEKDYICISDSNELITLLHSILIYHYSNFRPYLEQLILDNDFPAVDWSEVKKDVFLTIAEHLKEKTDKPMDFNDPLIIEKMTSILKPKPIHVNRKESK